MKCELARRTQRMNPSVIREILKVTELPGVISLAGGLPSPDSFPVQAMREASQRVLHDTPPEVLQYAASEGYGPLRERVAAELGSMGLAAAPERVLITGGSIRARFAAQRDATNAALARQMPARCRRNAPSGGMFFWVELPAGVDAVQLLPKAVQRGVAFVPGAAFYAARPRANTLRLSFLTASAAQINEGIRLLALTLDEAT